MKAFCLTFLAVSLLFRFSFAQWTNQTGTGNYYLTSGNAGIDTTAPSHSLTFSKASSGLALYNFSGSAGANYERLVVQPQSNSFTFGTYFGGTGQAWSIKLGVSTSAGATSIAGGRIFSVNWVASVGTGVFDFLEYTLGAGSIVTINAGVSASSGQQNMLAIQGTVDQTSSAAYTALLIAPYLSATGSGQGYLIDAGLNSAASGGGTHTSKFTIDANGDGYFAGTAKVGTTVLPTGYEMAVGGNMIAGSITIQAPSLWPDFVFAKDYPLMPLPQLDAYVRKNSRLPEMPSADQASQNGLNLGEMNQVLVKKVEELTLYVIQLNKQLKHQQKELNALKKKPSKK